MRKLGKNARTHLFRKVELEQLFETLRFLSEPPSIQRVTILTEDNEIIPVIAVKLTENHLHYAFSMGEALHESANIKN